MRKAIIVAAFAALAGCIGGPESGNAEVNVSAWKGEHLFFTFMHENATGREQTFQPAVEGAPCCFKGQAGILRQVKFETVPHGSEFAASRDWVAWGDKQELIPGEKREVACEFKVPAGAKPGVYKLKVGGHRVNLTVVDRTLPPPAKWRYHLDLWQHPWAVCRTADVKPFSDAHFEAMRPFWTMLAEAGQKVLTTTITKLPWNHQCFDGYDTMIKRVRKADGTWTYDYSLFDRYVEFGRGCGLGPDIACYTMCPWKYVVYWENEKGEEQKAEAKPGTPFFKEFWTPFLKDFEKHLAQKGWLEHAFIAMDERGPEDLKLIAALLKEVDSKLKVSMAGNMDPEKFKDLTFHCYSQYVHYVNPEFLKSVAARRAKGLVTTHYICCSPTRPNTFMDSAPAEAFWNGFYPAAAGLDGMLRWAWNSWPFDACNDASYGNWRAGDTFLVYPDGRPSRRFLELKNGIQAAEKFWILDAEAKGKCPVLNALRKKYDYAAASKEGVDLEPLKVETLAVLNGAK
ncbi:MAG: DUF4091 domain-containing protein [Kiritimatiellae bacterium]|nr:DUF4091 domain-containing protein [Kiritimatiellia bacterium]